MMLVVFAVTAATVYLTEENRRTNQQRLLDAQFTNRVRSFLALQEGRSRTIKEKCWTLAQAVRLRAALEEGDVEDLYQNARTELGEILDRPGRENSDAASGVRASFFCFFDANGTLVSPEKGAPEARTEKSFMEGLEAVEKALPGTMDQSVCYFALARSNRPEALREGVLTRIRDWNGRNLGTLAVGFPMGELQPSGAERQSGLRSGIWLAGRFYTDGLMASDRGLVAERMLVALNQGSRAPFSIDLTSGPQLVFFRALDAEMKLTSAYEVCLYPLAASIREERAVRWKIISFGLVVLLAGFGASLLLARRLSKPVERIVAGSKENLTRRVQAEENLREKNEELKKALEELRATQQQVIQQERLSAVGQMASGIAHDFNNTLMPILGFTELLLENDALLDDRLETRRCLEMVRTSAKDAASVVSRLREFYRPAVSDEAFPVVDLAKIVRQAVSLTEPKWRSQSQARGITFEVTIEIGATPFVAGEEAALREVLTNLIFNAVDAMPDGGRVSLQTAIEGTNAVVRVVDTGTGMSETVRQRCLEPFFSTKGENGTGLGLSMVHGIVERHQGRLEIESSAGTGTTFVIRLPLAAKAMGSVDAEEQTRATPSCTLNVLIVDDEAPALDVLSRYLRCDGHGVATAASGREALEKFRRNPFDLVVLDQGMPEMNGDQTARHIRKVRGDVPIIMLTGFSIPDSNGAKREAIDEILHKPVTLDALRGTIGRLLHAG
jgi:signal transduction histidine kinase